MGSRAVNRGRRTRPSGARTGTLESLDRKWEGGWGGRRELNPQPSEPQSDALPIELLPPQITIIAIAAALRSPAAPPRTGQPSARPSPAQWCIMFECFL